MVLGKWLLLRLLRKTIQKVKFLLILNVQKWRHVAPLIGSPSRRQLSFSDPPGLLDCTPKSNTTLDDREIGRSPVPIQRTASDADDIDRRADIFIANFYRHLQMERQVSLQLRYAKGNDGLERTPSY
ncbi:DUF761 domain-containing protein [Cinnamomum micranthum f. kanehirae]|uniref:DUF761 domain-containing protein n=1 Tax=Cinnamomum micranthum f. kanehirae TaxID=337451 RepID=A0A443NER0_9MAGN|nr:DUF761 domain-containing protein [Cinnamomum micranthum f. kanehirae]